MFGSCNRFGLFPFVTVHLPLALCCVFLSQITTGDRIIDPHTHTHTSGNSCQTHRETEKHLYYRSRGDIFSTVMKRAETSFIRNTTGVIVRRTLLCPLTWTLRHRVIMNNLWTAEHPTHISLDSAFTHTLVHETETCRGDLLGIQRLS